MSQIDFSQVLISTDPEPPYLVEYILYQGQMVIWAGEAGVGKSYLQYAMAMHIALGLPFLGLPTRQGKVLYFDEENGRVDLHQYLRWLWRGLGCPAADTLQANLHIESFSLAATANRKQRFAYMAQCSEKVQPALIVIDTATPVCAIEDENNNSEATRAIHDLRKVKDVAGADTVMIILKHIKFSHDLTTQQTIRGAKAWLDQTDQTIFQKVSAGRPRTDGLRNVRLTTNKVRAYGLRHEINIVPQIIQSGPTIGHTLTKI